ncbi:hypothetical protein [Streptomyces sp. NPDC058755]|uniref:hypothetical protein n=1 Tax=Streptomyces sp. NPDC058755 TaxID=3346624 RepID=UPI0036A392CE
MSPAQAAQAVLRTYRHAWVNCWEGRAEAPTYKSRSRAVRITGACLIKDALGWQVEKYIYSDIEAALHDVGEEAVRRGGFPQLKDSYVMDTFAQVRPLSVSNPEQIEEIRAWGRERAVPAGRAAVTPVPGDGGRTRRIVFMDE